MASPEQNLELVDNFLLGKQDDVFRGLENEFFLGSAVLAKARAQDIIRAMRDLSWYAIFNHEFRHTIARRSILEKTINVYRYREDGFFARWGLAGALRLALLRNIYKAATGGLWGKPDPSGLTEWLGSEAGGQVAYAAALRTDPHPEVRAMMLKITRDAALPAAWFARLKTERVFEALDVQIRESNWSPSERQALSALAGQSDGRVSSELAKLASSGVGALPAFPTGDAVEAPTPPPPPKPWYRSGWSWAISAGGVVGGGMLAARKR